MNVLEIIEARLALESTEKLLDYLDGWGDQYREFVTELFDLKDDLKRRLEERAHL